MVPVVTEVVVIEEAVLNGFGAVELLDDDDAKEGESSSNAEDRFFQI
jgi:hypothetical protein